MGRLGPFFNKFLFTLMTYRLVWGIAACYSFCMCVHDLGLPRCLVRPVRAELCKGPAKINHRFSPGKISHSCLQDKINDSLSPAKINHLFSPRPRPKHLISQAKINHLLFVQTQTWISTSENRSFVFAGSHPSWSRTSKREKERERRVCNWPGCR